MIHMMATFAKNLCEWWCAAAFLTGSFTLYVPERAFGIIINRILLLYLFN